MQSKVIKFDDEARNKLSEGVDTVANAVKVTLGARGRNVIIGEYGHTPHITKDGVTVARSIFLEDTVADLGAQVIKDIAQRTNDLAGDGTTTATVLAQSIYKRGLRYIVSGSNPMLLKRGIDKMTKIVVNQLKQLAVPVGDKIKSVATISANNDENIGEIIESAIKSVTKDGVITVEAGTGFQTELEVTEGMQYLKGYLSRYFVTDPIKMECVFDNPILLLYNGRINTIQQLLRSLEISNETKRPIVIMCDDMSLDVQNVVIMNKIKGSIQVCLSKPPSFGENRKDMMEDIAVLTGGLVMKEDIGLSLSDITIDQFGKCEKIIITEDSTTIIGGKGVKSEIDQRVEQIKYKISNNPSGFDKEQYEERLAKLIGGVAVLRVGGSSEMDIKEKKDRYDDALNATKAAVEEGIIPGGGVALLKLSLLNSSKINEFSFHNMEERMGAQIVLEAIREPFNCIITNAGHSPDLILSSMKDYDGDFGFDVNSEEIVNMIENGIIDPLRVTRVALENAVSIAGLLLTTECVITDKEYKQNS